MTDSKSLLIVAGEASGDLHGSNLVREVSRLDPSVRFSGIGGDMMRAAGVDIVHHVRDMSVVGIFEVIGKFPVIRKAMKDMENLMDEIRPGAVILIDYPDFNLRLAKKAKERGIKVIYYISPQVWAWRKGRVKTISKVVDKMLVVFPFEVPIYKAADVDVEFVGHPLMDIVPADTLRDEARDRLGLGGSGTVIGLLPGSRHREVGYLLPEMLVAAGLVSKEVDGVRFAIPVANTLDVGYIKGFVSGTAGDVRVFEGKTYDVMAASDILVVASGTATLEAAIIGTPMVITYRMLPLTYIVGKMLVDIELGGLPNIVAGRGIVPELIQGNATGERIAGEVLTMLNDKRRMTGMREDLRKVRDALGGPGASRRAAEIVYRAV